MILRDKIQNRTLTTARALPSRDLRGADVVLVVVKLALAFDLEGRLALAARPVRLHDEPDDDGGLRFPHENDADKPGTDVGLVGSLVPPASGAAEVVANLKMGPVEKGIRATGPATFRLYGQTVAAEVTPRFSDPIPLTYGRCHGGRAESFASENELNPIGTGHRAELGWAGKPAPRLTTFDVAHGPAEHACFAPLPRGFAPRRHRAGTYDARWARERAPLAPEDRDPLYASWASSSLHASRPLCGDEELRIGGVYGGAEVRLSLPLHPVRVTMRAGRDEERAPHLDGVLVDADRQVVELVWRAAFTRPKKLEQIERIRVETERDVPDEIVDRAFDHHPENGA